MSGILNPTKKVIEPYLIEETRNVGSDTSHELKIDTINMHVMCSHTVYTTMFACMRQALFAAKKH